MCGEKNKLSGRKEIRTYAKRFVTALSIILGIGYIATLLFHISGFSLYFAIAGTVISAISLALNIWSRTDHFQKQDLDKKTDMKEKTSGQKKLTKIYLGVASSASFL